MYDLQRWITKLGGENLGSNLNDIKIIFYRHDQREYHAKHSDYPWPLLRKDMKTVNSWLEDLQISGKNIVVTYSTRALNTNVQS